MNQEAKTKTVVMMNPQHKQQGTCSPKMLKLASVFLGMCLAACIIGPPLYWHLSETFSSFGHYSCPPCHCHCNDRPFVSISHGLNLSSFTDCMKYDSQVDKEAEKSLTDMLSKALAIKVDEAHDNQKRGDIALLEAKKMASQYQKEADKCNAGMETCEEAREKSEEALRAQEELTAMWELRARQKGWKEDSMSSSIEERNSADI